MRDFKVWIQFEQPVRAYRINRSARLVKYSGFSLLEMVVVLAVVGVLLSGGLSLYSEQSRHHKWKASAVKLGFVKNALQHFSRTRHYLPCPDTDGDGVENRVGGFHCLSARGKVPFVTLGVTLQSVRDGWGNAFLYAVPQNATLGAKMRDCPRDIACFFNKDAPPKFDLTTLAILSTLATGASAEVEPEFGGLKVCTSLPCTANTSGSQVEADGAIVVLVALNENGNRASIAGTAEALNQAESRFFVKASASRAPFFDDHIQVVSANALKSRHQTKVAVRVSQALPPLPSPPQTSFQGELSGLVKLTELSNEGRAENERLQVLLP